jgi:hypothetical protein
LGGELGLALQPDAQKHFAQNRLHNRKLVFFQESVKEKTTETTAPPPA